MNIPLVRVIDYWFGIPICFILTIIEQFNRRLPFRKRRPIYKKILFIQLSEMSSAILAYPTMKYLKQKYPDSELFFMIFEKNRPSVDMLGIIKKENILTINEKSLFWFVADVLKNILRLHREKIDVVFDYELFSRASAILTYLSGAPMKVGFYRYRMEGLYRGSFFTHKIQYNFQQHISKLFLLFAKVLEEQEKKYPTAQENIPNTEIEQLSYKSSQECIDKIWKKLKTVNESINKNNNLIILNPSAGLLPIRAWSVDNYIELARRILGNQNNWVILTGIESDRKITHNVSNALNSKRCIDFTGRTTFPDLVDLYSISDVLITNDSGPAHFASLTNIKNFVFFGPETPILYAPIGKNTRIIYSNFPCSPCITAFNHRYTSCIDNKCLQAISVDEVYELIKRELGVKK